MRRCGLLALLPLDERPKPTHTFGPNGVVPLAKMPAVMGRRGVRPGALFMPTPDGKPPPDFVHVWLSPADQVRLRAGSSLFMGLG